MHQFSYNEVLDDSGFEARRNERDAFDRVITLLRSAQAKGPRSVETAHSVYRLRQLWTLLIEDLSSNENALPSATKASLISIGIWMLKESDSVSSGSHDSLETMIAINTMIRDGLR